MTETDPTERCSFCQKNIGSVRYLVRSPRAGICDECVLLSMEILVENKLVPKTKLLAMLWR